MIVDNMFFIIMLIIQAVINNFEYLTIIIPYLVMRDILLFPIFLLMSLIGFLLKKHNFFYALILNIILGNVLILILLISENSFLTWKENLAKLFVSSRHIHYYYPFLLSSLAIFLLAINKVWGLSNEAKSSSKPSNWRIL